MTAASLSSGLDCRRLSLAPAASHATTATKVFPSLATNSRSRPNSLTGPTCALAGDIRDCRLVECDEDICGLCQFVQHRRDAAARGVAKELDSRPQVQQRLDQFVKRRGVAGLAPVGVQPLARAKTASPWSPTDVLSEYAVADRYAVRPQVDPHPEPSHAGRVQEQAVRARPRHHLGITRHDRIDATGAGTPPADTGDHAPQRFERQAFLRNKSEREVERFCAPSRPSR